MPPHLSHKIAWEKLGAMYVHQKTQKALKRSPAPLPHHANELKHIAYVFAATLREFKETDKTSDEDKRALDARQWGDYDWSLWGFGGGYVVGIYSSLIWGYIELNLLLLDPIRFGPLVTPNGRKTPVMGYVLGRYDNGHDKDIAAHLAQVFIDYETLKPLTLDVLDILREHAKLLFKCMYLISGENELLTDQTIFRLLIGFFGWHNWIKYDEA